MVHILFFGMDGAIAAVDISLPGQDLYPIARLPIQLEMKSGRNGAEVVGGGGQERVEVVSPSGAGISYPREDLPMEGQDCSYVGTPSVQHPPLVRPRLEVAAELRTPGWGVRGLDDDSTAGYLCRVCAGRCTPMRMHGRLWHHDGCPAAGGRVGVRSKSQDTITRRARRC